jgi:mRNA-degrading endonuclease YafQ of YafQ-DinJ toxin-antitoxin module
MRTIEWTTAFKRDYRKALANPRHRDLAQLLEQVAEGLAEDRALADKFRDHALSGGLHKASRMPSETRFTSGLQEAQRIHLTLCLPRFP